jgi:colanic acid/amylovoran biosynthesis protein
MAHPSKLELHIGLLWHTPGHDNLGVDALSRSNMALIEEAATAEGIGVRFTSFGGKRSGDVLVLPPNLTEGVSPSLRDFATGRWDFFREIAACDMVFDIGEGDSFTDIYGIKRFAIQTLTKLAALGQRVPLVLSPQTIGPFDNPLNRRIATAVMNRARAVLARDHLSKSFLDAHVRPELIDEFIDVAFALPFVASAGTDKVRVGMNTSGLLFNGGYTGKNELGLTLDYAQLSRQLVQRLLEAGAEVHLFAHVSDRRNQDGAQASRDDDRSATAALHAEFPTTVLAPSFADASQAKGWMSGLDFVIAGRMHACIGAFSAGVPVVPIAYSRKFNGLFQSLGYDYFIDGKASDTQPAIEQTMAWFATRDALRTAVAAGKAKADAKLDRYRERLRALLGNLAATQNTTG